MPYLSPQSRQCTGMSQESHCLPVQSATGTGDRLAPCAQERTYVPGAALCRRQQYHTLESSRDLCACVRRLEASQTRSCCAPAARTGRIRADRHVVSQNHAPHALPELFSWRFCQLFRLNRGPRAQIAALPRLQRRPAEPDERPPRRVVSCRLKQTDRSRPPPAGKLLIFAPNMTALPPGPIAGT